MRRIVSIAALLLLGLLSTGLYMTESKVEQMRRRLAALDGELLREQNNVQVLKAEWSYLNQPERLQELAMRHLDRVGLQAIAPSQIGNLDSLPMRPVAPEPGTGRQMVGLPRPAFKPAPPPGVVFASTEAGR